ncbi:WD40/YVTN repeat-like-containing domain [Cinara cedri]|uniref:WD40/YVTN repeat-like-containing domain n=1 Tax=Cinara cedri TaxID=506608 RepID=A0A5E4M9V0_9HEMI|nr:WD40/YVTN repeat-like-containing domain [Cinara cedri]
MNTNVKGSCVDVIEFKCPAFCNLRVFNEGHKFDLAASMIISSNRFGIAFVASPNNLCLILMKHVRQLTGDFGIEKNTLTNFLRREIELGYTPNFLDLSCDEGYIAVAGTSNSKPCITVYNVEELISQNYITPLVYIEFEATQESHVIDMSWNPGVQNSLACCLSDGSFYVIELKDGGTYSLVSLPPQSSTLCLSWSPKGKQIIIGSSNGCLTQYKPELKAVKQFSPPTDVTGNVKPIKVKWISNFQFAVIYDFLDNTDDQPSLYILNTPKNAPVEFINFEQFVISNVEQYRSNQYYTTFIPNWNLLFAASSNCSEIGVMGINKENKWQCWVLEIRPELPYRLDKQIYPLGMSLDFSSQMKMKQISKANEEIFLDPMPVLCVLSTDGILFMYHIENQLTGYNNICKTPSEISDNIITQLFTTDSKINYNQETEDVVVTEITEQVEEINAVDEKSKGDHNESVLASYLESSITSQAEQQIVNSPKISVVKPNAAVSIATISPVQKVPSQSNLSDNNTSADEAANRVMLNEVFEDIQLFQLQLDNVLKLSSNTSKLKIGDEKDKETLVKKWTSLDLFFKELNETNRSQWAESKALQKAVLDSIAWIEDSKSRLFFLKNPKYKCLLRNDSDEPFSKTLFENIERTLYYIETQLAHVDDQLKARYDSYSPSNKELKIPCLETIYKSLVVNTNIVNKLKEKINHLCNIVEEVKYRTFKKLTVAPDIVQNASRLNVSRDVGLSKLSEQLLKITLDKDGVSAINSYNVAKKYSVLSANQRALSISKVNKLQEWLKDFKTRRTKVTRSNYANIDLSRPMCSTPLKPLSKQKVHEKTTEFPSIETKEKFASNWSQNPILINKIDNFNIEKNTGEIPVSLTDLTQLKEPIFIPTTQTDAVKPTAIANIIPLGSQILSTNSGMTSVWNPLDNTSTPKQAITNKFDFKGFTKDPMTINSAAPASIFGSNTTSTSVSGKDPVDFSLKSSTITPLDFSKSVNMVSTKSTLDVISGVDSKEKTPFSFISAPSVKTETTIPKSTISNTFNFTDSIKNKMNNQSQVSGTTFSFDTTKTLPKPLETPNIFSGFISENKSKNKQETEPKDPTLNSFNFSSKSDTTSFSTFSFTTPKDNIVKTIASEPKAIFTSAFSTAATASFNFSIPKVKNEPVSSSAVSSTVGIDKPSDFSTVHETSTTTSSVTETTPKISENPTPIISEPVTPEKENLPIIPETANSASLFEIPSTSTSLFNSSVNPTSTASFFENTKSTISQASIFNTTSTSAPSIFSTPTNTTNTPSIFGTPTNTTKAPSIFGTPTNVQTSSSIFGTPNSITTTSSIFGTSVTSTTSSIFVNTTKTTSSIFGTPSTTTVSSIFGSATTTNTTGGFGSNSTTSTMFGTLATTSSSMFGNPTVSASSTSIFGSASTTTSSIFGAPTVTSTTSSIFGSPSTTATSSGLFGSVAAAANQPSAFGQPLGFSSPGSAFGNMSIFGQGCSPSQPNNSFTQASNPFAVNKTPTSTPSLFSSQKNVFGQPAANTTNTGFGAASSGFGATATTGFGSSAMNQSSNLGFGSVPMFGSMGGTAYDMSKSSGFGQTPVFGGAATFGSPNQSQYTFGQNSTTPESGTFGFGSATQQPSTAFASLAAQTNSPSFGNIAQNQNAGFTSPASTGFGQPQQTSPFKPQAPTFGGSSFSSWR